MPTTNEPYTTYDHGWIVRVRRPSVTTDPRVLLLLHGWTGDETVMWIFTHNLPENYWILAPRGPVQASEKGYGWLPDQDKRPDLDDFNDVTRSFMQVMQRWVQDFHLPTQPFSVMGFSQGAAMAYALTASYPRQVDRLIALAGFLPRDRTMPGRYAALKGKKVFIAHGSKDETVPVTLARETVQTLQAIGADVTYCESDVGHKLSAGCLRGLRDFMQ